MTHVASEGQPLPPNVYANDGSRRDSNAALATVLASLAAAAGLHAATDGQRPDTHTPSPPSLPLAGQPNADAARHREQFTMPSASPRATEPPLRAPAVSATPTQEAYNVAMQPTATVQATSATSSMAAADSRDSAYLPFLAKPDGAVDRRGIMAAGAENNSGSSTAVDTAVPAATATQRMAGYTDIVATEPVAQRQTIESVLKELKDATGIQIILAMDYYPKADIEGYIATEKSVADENLQRIVAAILLKLPPKVRNIFITSGNRVVIARNIPDELASFPNNEVVTLMRIVQDESGAYKILDVFDGSMFDKDVAETPMSSGLQPATEAELAVYDNLIHDYFLSESGQKELEIYIQDNLSETDIDNAKYLKMLEILGYSAETGFVTLEELAARLNAFKMIGRNDVVERVRALGVLKMGHMVWL